MEPTKERREEIQQMAIESINWMGSHFFKVNLTLKTVEEAVYAAGLWGHASRDGLVVTYYP
jgi:hypothetical protein